VLSLGGAVVVVSSSESVVKERSVGAGVLGNGLASGVAVVLRVKVGTGGGVNVKSVPFDTMVMSNEGSLPGKETGGCVEGGFVVGPSSGTNGSVSFGKLVVISNVNVGSLPVKDTGGCVEGGLVVIGPSSGKKGSIYRKCGAHREGG